MREFISIQYDKNSVINNELWASQKYLNCTFSNINLNEIRIVDCTFHNCVFNRCSFKKGFLGSSDLFGKSGEYSGCQFLNCDLTAVNFQSPIIDHCLFKDCNLNETDFDGSIISNTKFIGVLDSCFFRGHSKFSGASLLSFFGRHNQKKKVNKMLNVDFSEAKLIGVLFENEIDLSHSIFPEGDDYAYLNNLTDTVVSVKEEVLQWIDPEEQRIALRLIENLYYNRNKVGQKTDFIDRFLPLEMEKGNLNGPNVKLFDLMKKHA